jgi:hypothetical protein
VGGILEFQQAKEWMEMMLVNQGTVVEAETQILESHLNRFLNRL